jgi:hypothetical protein
MLVPNVSAGRLFPVFGETFIHAVGRERAAGNRRHQIPLSYT